MSGRSRGAGKVVAVVASPLEAAVAGRLAAARPEEVELVYRPDLLPPPRFPADHGAIRAGDGRRPRSKRGGRCSAGPR